MEDGGPTCGDDCPGRVGAVATRGVDVGCGCRGG